MDKIWGAIMIISFVFAIISGNVKESVSVLFDATKQAITTCTGILGIICLWSRNNEDCRKIWNT